MSSSTFKVVLLGEGRVGKTSLISRFVNDKFDSEEVSTVQASMYNKKKVVVDGRPVDLSIWDTAGQERFHALGPIYYRNSNGAVLVYDITDADTFEKVKMWIKELKAVVGEQISIVICGNKCDMERERDIDEAIAEKYARKENALHFSTSAKLNKNVSEAFEGLARSILAMEGSGGGGVTANSGSANNRGGAKKKKGGLRIDEDSSSAPPPPPPAGAGSGVAGGASSSSSSRLTDNTVATGGGASSYDDYYNEKPASASSSAPPPKQEVASSKPAPQRKNTIILSETKKPSEGAGAGGGGNGASGSGTAGGGDNGKKKKGCCA